jgi:hypothetical protein
LLLYCSSHSNLKISFQTFEFWTEYKNSLKKLPNISEPSSDYLLEPYIELCKILIEKCKMASKYTFFIIFRISQTKNPSTKGDDEDCEFDLDNMGISDYRYKIYNVLLKYLIKFFLTTHNYNRFFVE